MRDQQLHLLVPNDGLDTAPHMTTFTDLTDTTFTMSNSDAIDAVFPQDTGLRHKVD
ncbi:hypothetical protein Vi05172_g4477 [Venturia inaequalis]|nr:hypothetical protein Vi05172_g4477 [Venturia inaequalis]